MKIGSLFSGYGGLDLGISQVIDARPVWFSEIEKAPSQILAHHWPDVPNLGDITAIDWGDVEPVDILTGGFPCQDVSHAGRRAGLIRDGEGKTRSGLWGEMLRAIVELKPALVIAENVRGLLSAKADSDVEPCTWCMGDGDAVDMRALGAVLADLADAGYDACWTGLRAADIGAPHNRFRVFIAAWPRGSAFRYAGHDAGSAQQWVEPESTASGVRESGAVDHVTLLPTPSVADVEGGRKTRSGDRSNELLLNGIAAEQRFGDYGPAVALWEHVINRPAPPPTEPTGRDGGQRLSPAFVEWMMGLPAGHVTDVPGLSRVAQLKALGNGVVPQQAAAAITDLLTIRQEVAA